MYGLPLSAAIHLPAHFHLFVCMCPVWLLALSRGVAVMTFRWLCIRRSSARSVHSFKRFTRFQKKKRPAFRPAASDIFISLTCGHLAQLKNIKWLVLFKKLFFFFITQRFENSTCRCILLGLFFRGRWKQRRGQTKGCDNAVWNGI